MTGRRTRPKTRSAFVLVIATAWSMLSPGAGSPPLSAEETQISFSDKKTRESCRGASNPSPGCTIRLHADPSSDTATLSVSSDTGANGTMPSEDVASWGTAVLSAQYPAGAPAGQLTFSAAVPVKQAAWETKSASGQAYASAAVYIEVRDASGRAWVDSAPIPRSMPQGTVIPVSVTLPAGSAGSTIPVRVGLSAFAGVGNTAPTMYLPHEVCASYGWDGPCASLPLGYPFKHDPGRVPNPMYYAAPNPTAVGKATFLLEATGAINDVVKPEGSGAPGQTTPFEFTVTVTPPAVRPVTVDFAATAGSALPSSTSRRHPASFKTSCFVHFGLIRKLPTDLRLIAAQREMRESPLPKCDLTCAERRDPYASVVAIRIVQPFSKKGIFP